MWFHRGPYRPTFKTNPLCSCLILYCTVLHLFSARNTVPDVTYGIGQKSINTFISCTRNLLLRQSIYLFQIRCPNQPPNFNQRFGRDFNLTTGSSPINQQAFLLSHIRHLYMKSYLNLGTGGALYLNICSLSNTRIRLPDTLPYFFQNCRKNTQPYLIFWTGREVQWANKV